MKAEWDRPADAAVVGETAAVLLRQAADPE